MTTVRKSLHPLQQAAGDKENLVGPGRMIHADKDNLKSLRETNENEKVSPPVSDPKTSSNKRKKVFSKSIQVGNAKPVITEEDITSSASPSENYWEVLAEQRRLALEETLIENEKLHMETDQLQLENKKLHEKIARLEEENKICKEVLEEHKSLVDVLKEMLNDPADESVNINDSLEG